MLLAANLSPVRDDRSLTRTTDARSTDSALSPRQGTSWSTPKSLKGPYFEVAVRSGTASGRVRHVGRNR